MINNRKKFIHNYYDIISIENLLSAWKEFLRGKRNKPDVQRFRYRLFDEIYLLHQELKKGTYKHGGYFAFNISDPKPRNIHKASVRDRLLHHAIYRLLYPFFDKTFIADSYSCRTDKGTLAAINRFRAFSYKVSKNNTRTVWVLKCDIQKFFASIDHRVLIQVIKQYISDDRIIWLLEQVINSYNPRRAGKGLPLGNLTSQLFANIYMNEFDQFTKHKLRAKCYLRYTDDFVFLSNDRRQLELVVLLIKQFLKVRLKISLHPDKVFIKTLTSGVDFLGWVHFADHRVLRTTTKRKILGKVKRKEVVVDSIQSYLGLLKHGNTHKLKKHILSFLPVSYPNWS